MNINGPFFIPTQNSAAFSGSVSPSSYSDDVPTDGKFVEGARLWQDYRRPWQTEHGNGQIGWQDGQVVWKDMPRTNGARTECGFCKNNGEALDYYTSHITKDEQGVVLCPILWNYTCPICGSTGDNAHTIKYCPRNKDGRYNNGASLTDLKKLRNATGKFRSNGGKTVVNQNGRPIVGRETVNQENERHSIMRRQLHEKSLELEQLRQQFERHVLFMDHTQSYPGPMQRQLLPLPMQGNFSNVQTSRLQIPNLMGAQSPLFTSPPSDVGQRFAFQGLDCFKEPMIGQNTRYREAGTDNYPEDSNDELGRNLAQLREGSQPFGGQ